MADEVESMTNPQNPVVEDDAGAAQLKRLKRLLDEGLISDREYAEKKAEVLGLPFTLDEAADHSGSVPAAPPTAPRPLRPHAEGRDATGGLIPYKNVPALLAYYFGVFGLIPMLGLPLAIAAVILGITGFGRRRTNPAVAGGFHSAAGVVLGSFSICYHSAILILVLVM